MEVLKNLRKQKFTVEQLKVSKIVPARNSKHAQLTRYTACSVQRRVKTLVKSGDVS